MVRHLADAWITLARRAGARDDVAGAGAALLGRWSEPHRAYHDLAHLDEVLHRIDLLAGEADRPDLVRLAAWFHDAVYDPRATDNEERSAEVATVALADLGLAPDAVAEVARLVRLTATLPSRPATATVPCCATPTSRCSRPTGFATSRTPKESAASAPTSTTRPSPGAGPTCCNDCSTGRSSSRRRTAGASGSRRPARTSPQRRGPSSPTDLSPPRAA